MSLDRQVEFRCAGDLRRENLRQQVERGNGWVWRLAFFLGCTTLALWINTSNLLGV